MKLEGGVATHKTGVATESGTGEGRQQRQMSRLAARPGRLRYVPEWRLHALIRRRPTVHVREPCAVQIVVRPAVGIVRNGTVAEIGVSRHVPTMVTDYSQNGTQANERITYFSHGQQYSTGSTVMHNQPTDTLLE
jgi:hypothetical protein